MHITLILSICLNMYAFHISPFLPIEFNCTTFSGVCVYYWITKYYCTYPPSTLTRLHTDGIHVPIAGAIIFTVIALFSILSYFGFRSRIPLASLLLQVVMDISKHHMSVFAVAFISLLIQAALSV